jgi:glycosyltransferase involved in cell wall biosynthesis
MLRLDTEILFVLPRASGAEPQNAAGVTPAAAASPTATGLMTFKAVPSTIVSPYPAAGLAATGRTTPAGDPVVLTLKRGPLCVMGAGAAGGYEGDLISRVELYAKRCDEMTQDESFDVVHAHDWVTFPAGMRIAARSGKPLVVHVHSTEFDRSGENINHPVYQIERRGMRAARTIIAVSHLTKRTVVERYGVPPEKVRVAHNGIDLGRAPAAAPAGRPDGNGRAKTVLFLGRLTMQKGASFFVNAAARILARRDDVRFIIAGWGDLGPQTVEQVAAMGLGAKVRFTGFLRGPEVEQAYRMADVYVMPSVSEPFGLTALEAIRQGVPVILSKNSGVAEVLPHGALKVDFWDVDRMADQVLSVLDRPDLRESLRRSGAAEIRALTWDRTARRCLDVYQEQMAECLN